jgi:hypothetical protein
MSEAKERLLLDVGRDVGLLDLPAPAIVRIVTSLKDVCARESVAAPAETPTATAQQQPKPGDTRPVTRSRRSTGGATDGAVAVVVKAACGVGKVKREALEKAVLTWSGKAAHWHGRVDADTAEMLRAVFPGKVTIEAQAHSTKVTRPAPIADETGREGVVEAAAPVVLGGAPAVADGLPVGDGAGVEKPLEAPAAVQDSHGEPKAVLRTPVPSPASGAARAAAPARPLPRPLPPGAAH